jgi:hypothetical protein
MERAADPGTASEIRTGRRIRENVVGAIVRVRNDLCRANPVKVVEGIACRKIAERNALACWMSRAHFEHGTVTEHDAHDVVVRHGRASRCEQRDCDDCVVIDGVDQITDAQIGDSAFAAWRRDRRIG